VRCAHVALALCALACAAEPAPVARRGLEARIALDRSEALVGDRVGVTIEVDVPPGFEVQTPFLPASASFVTDAIESAPAPAGTERRVLLWTLRPRQVGNQRLPELSIPFTAPGGEVDQLVLAGLPLRVLSVRGQLPERDASFDIRPAPAAPRDATRLWLGLAALALGAALTLYAARRARRHSADPRQLARASLAALAAARAAAPREAARLGASALRAFAAERWQLDLAARTPGELGDPIAAAQRASLAALERARFARAPLASEVTSSLDAAAEYLSDVVRS
jgi:hypothetical protein